MQRITKANGTTRGILHCSVSGARVSVRHHYQTIVPDPSNFIGLMADLQSRLSWVNSASIPQVDYLLMSHGDRVIGFYIKFAAV